MVVVIRWYICDFNAHHRRRVDDCSDPWLAIPTVEHVHMHVVSEFWVFHEQFVINLGSWQSFVFKAKHRKQRLREHFEALLSQIARLFIPTHVVNFAFVVVVASWIYVAQRLASAVVRPRLTDFAVQPHVTLLVHEARLIELFSKANRVLLGFILLILWACAIFALSGISAFSAVSQFLVKRVQTLALLIPHFLVSLRLCRYKLVLLR